MKNFSCICLFVLFNLFSMDTENSNEEVSYKDIRQTLEYKSFFEELQELVKTYRSKYFSPILSERLKKRNFSPVNFRLDPFMLKAFYIREEYVFKFRKDFEKLNAADSENSIFRGKGADEMVVLFNAVCLNAQAKL